MQPHASTPSRQGGGNKKADKTGKTIPPSEIPPDHQGLEGVKEGIDEGAAPAGQTKPHVNHPNDHPEREVERKLHR